MSVEFKSFLGRRGLLNLGQTCYLNVVLQAFIHNPLLRNYFLSDTHNHKLCKIKDCVCCEMDKLFAEVIYSTECWMPITSVWLVARFTLPIPRLMGRYLFWHPLGELRLSCLVTPNKTHMSSSYPHWIKYIQLLGVRLTFLVIASFIPPSQENYKATWNVAVVEILLAQLIHCWTSAWSWKGMGPLACPRIHLQPAFAGDL